MSNFDRICALERRATVAEGRLAALEVRTVPVACEAHGGVGCVACTEATPAAPASACDEACVGACDQHAKAGSHWRQHWDDLPDLSVPSAAKPCRNWRCSGTGPAHKAQPSVALEDAAYVHPGSGRLLSSRPVIRPPSVAPEVAYTLDSLAARGEPGAPSPVALTDKERDIVCTLLGSDYVLDSDQRILRDLLRRLGVEVTP